MLSKCKTLSDFQLIGNTVLCAIVAVRLLFRQPAENHEIDGT